MTIWPMGCKKIKSEGELDELLASPLYIGQEKVDGVRAILEVKEDGSFKFTTRGSTKADPLTPIDITHRLPHIARYKVVKLAGTILDGELYDPNLTSSQLAGIVNYRSEVPVPKTIQFRVFDILALQGKLLMKYELRSRLQVLDKVMESLKMIKEVVSIPYVEGEIEKRELLNRLLSQGFEGMVLKNLTSPYYEDSKKAGSWYKFKKKDTIDVRIVGSKPPEQFYVDPVTREPDYTRETIPWKNKWLGSIEFIFTLKGQGYSGYCSGLSNETKEAISQDRQIKPEYIGRWMEVEYMEKTTDGNLRHPRFVRIREEIEK